MIKYLFMVLFPVFLYSANFKIASYNVENLFDMKKDGNEYRGYIPNGKYGWNDKIYKIKLANTARVLKDLRADIVALQEIESKKALLDLQKELKANGVSYPYVAIADLKDTSIKCSIISKFPIKKTREIKVSDLNKDRNILEVHFNIEGSRLIVFVNHWKSKRSGEKRRLVYAKALKKRIEALPEDADYIILGDLNSNYNEFETFKNNKKLNNTGGKTGINHVLLTLKDRKPVLEEQFKSNFSSGYLYNLWLELPAKKRWSYVYRAKKNSPDHIIVPSSLYDEKGVSYADNSFGVFKKNYMLLRRGSPKRWQRKRGWGKHLGKGYSDHLPVYAEFYTR